MGRKVCRLKTLPHRESQPSMNDGFNPTRGSPLFTVGHSNHEWDVFVELLRRHHIDVLVDVRSHPYSKYAPHFNMDRLKEALPTSGIRYLFMGEELGGRPSEEDLYDQDGHVLYYRLAETALFQAGLARIKKGMEKFRVAMMCSEENPAVCHRFLLVTKVLAKQGLEIQHIRGDGSLQSDGELRREVDGDVEQGLLFPEMKTDSWKSLRSVLPKAPPLNSLES